jgi:hypothetical protein
MSFVPYQIDYSVKNAAKTIAFSKKRVTFKFGFASPSALKDGSQGPACRGSEHELTFVWSLATGKRQLLLDNKDLHFSESGQNGWTTDRVWQHAFSVRDAATGHTYRAIFISQAAINPRDNTPQHPFDLKIGGVSYFNFNALYQLGTPSMIVHHEARSGHSRGSTHHFGRDSPMTAEERQQLAVAKLASLQDIARREAQDVEKIAAAVAGKRPDTSSSSSSALPPAMKHEEASLISFDDDPAPPPPVPVGASLQQQQQQPITSIGGTPNATNNNYYYASSLTLDPMLDPAQNLLAAPAPAATSSFYGNNPYAAPPPASTMPYSVNPYAAPTASSANPYGSYPAALAPMDTSQALTPYNPSGSSYPSQQPQQPYVDATGRFAVGPPMAAAAAAPNNPAYASFYDLNSTSSHSASGMTAAAPNAASYNLASPGAVSYGSAPSFAQPPQPPPPVPAATSSFASSMSQPPMYPTFSSAPPSYYPPSATTAATQPMQQPLGPPPPPPPPPAGSYYYQPPPTTQTYNY